MVVKTSNVLVRDCWFLSDGATAVRYLTRRGAAARSDENNEDYPKITRSEGYLSRINPDLIDRKVQRHRCRAQFLFPLDYWHELRQKTTRASSMLHLKSEQSCVTVMLKEEGAPFLSLTAGGAPRFKMLLPQPKPKVTVSFNRVHLRTQNISHSIIHLTSWVC